MNWRGIIDYVGVPAIMKDAHTGGRRISQRVYDVDDLIQKYDESDTLTVILQEVIDSDYHVHCFAIGQEYARVIRYLPEEQAYLPDDESLSTELAQTIREQTLRVCQAYGYDMNMLEFVVKDDTPYIINPTNPAPDMDINLLKPNHFSWCVARMADVAIKVAKQRLPQVTGWQLQLQE